MRIGSLFSGIGGLELGLEVAGLGPVAWQVEKSPFCRQVLERHWPGVERYEDVKEVGAHNLEPVDLICGGFPCQDLSSAGKGAGLTGSRSGLWGEFARVVEETRPRWVVVENVSSGAKRWVNVVVSRLGQLGYEALPVPLSAKDVGAPHRRARVFIVAHADGQPLRVESGRCGRPDGEGAPLAGQHGEARDAADPSDSLVEGQRVACGVRTGQFDTGSVWYERPPVSPICGVDDGVPGRVDRLRALGNAVVPQCAEVVGWMIRELEGI